MNNPTEAMRIWATQGVLEGQTTPGRWDRVADQAKRWAKDYCLQLALQVKRRCGRFGETDKALTGNHRPHRYPAPTTIAGMRRDRGLG